VWASQLTGRSTFSSVLHEEIVIDFRQKGEGFILKNLAQSTFSGTVFEDIVPKSADDKAALILPLGQLCFASTFTPIFPSERPSLFVVNHVVSIERGPNYVCVRLASFYRLGNGLKLVMPFR